jgi:hypothetical protein
MNKTSFFLTGLILGFLLSWSLNIGDKIEIVDDVKVVKIDSSLTNKIKELEYENDILKDELQMKESEISYWGRKYDDLKLKQK